MKKVTYNIFYEPEMTFLHKDGTVTHSNLGLFTEESDAQLAISLMYKIEPILRKHLVVKLSHEHSVKKKQILETEKVSYYNSLKEFAKDNAYMKLFAQHEGFNKLLIMVEEKIARYSYLLNE